MTKKTLLLLTITLFIFSCASIPKESVTLSETLGNDLEILHNSHIELVQLFYDKIKTDVNIFIDDVYSPFVVHYVLKEELDNYQLEEHSLFGVIEIAGTEGGKKETDEALNEMLQFQEAARIQINKKRNELLIPVEKQEKEIINKIHNSYENAINANSAITVYLSSIRKVKESQQAALSIIGLEGTDVLITDALIELSEQVSNALETGREIDIKSEDAYEKLEIITKKIKELTNKN